MVNPQTLGLELLPCHLRLLLLLVLYSRFTHTYHLFEGFPLGNRSLDPYLLRLYKRTKIPLQLRHVLVVQLDGGLILRHVLRLDKNRL